MEREPLEIRFWNKVEKTENCWNWQGGRNQKGYGRFRVGKNKVAVHRWVYEQTYGPIPDELEIDHLCSNRACVKLEHLEVVTHRVNVLRGNGLTAKMARATHCPHGHTFSPENTYVIKNYRVCRTCRYERQKNWRAAQNTKIRSISE